mmetsp:Transcript_74510/g.120257  ORF Transcript_74510/g.120257 Transcript_74510/m.120257 type:complete len:239 (+) Transcript_74510:484-1200(+)
MPLAIVELIAHPRLVHLRGQSVVVLPNTIFVHILPRNHVDLLVLVVATPLDDALLHGPERTVAAFGYVGTSVPVHARLFDEELAVLHGAPLKTTLRDAPELWIRGATAVILCARGSLLVRVHYQRKTASTRALHGALRRANPWSAATHEGPRCTTCLSRRTQLCRNPAAHGTITARGSREPRIVRMRFWALVHVEHVTILVPLCPGSVGRPPDSRLLELLLLSEIAHLPAHGILGLAV